MPKRKIMSAITEQTKEFITKNFKNPGNGSSYILEMFPGAFKREMAEIKKDFSSEELAKIINHFRMSNLHADMAGAGLALVESVNLEKVKSCSPFQRACLEIWAKAFWLHGNGRDLDEYIK